MPQLPTPVVRPATSADLDRCLALWAASEDFVVADTPGGFALHAHELATGTMVVAEAAGVVVGFAAVLTRSGVDYLADVFVDPTWQGRGIGSALVAAHFAGSTRPRFTFASAHPGAARLYERWGMRPGWGLATVALADLAVVEELGGPPTGWSTRRVGVEAVAGLDTDVTGRNRRVDLAYEVGPAGADLVGVYDGAELVGYGVVVNRRPWDRVVGRIRLAPVVAASPAALGRVWVAVARWARTNGAGAALTFMAQDHPLVGRLTRAGATVSGVDRYRASAPALIDPTRYWPSTGTA
jgi:GNAT superfamily N-acetyltransferase